MRRSVAQAAWGRVGHSRVRIPVVAAVLAALASLLPVGWSASGAGPAFTYRPIATMPFGTNEAQSIVVGDKLYIFGGFDTTKETFTPTSRAWVYDPATNVWSGLPAMPVDGITHAGIATDGSRYIYYAGGNASADDATQQVFGTVDAWRYDTVTGTYTALPDLPQARSAGGLAYVSGKLYYFGGNNLARSSPDGSETWMLDVAGGATSWVNEASMPDPRNHLGFAVINGLIYAVGGQYVDQAYYARASLDRYDPVANTWTVLTPMPFARSHVMDSTFVMNGELVVAGGWTTTAVTASVIAYDPASGTWGNWQNLPEARTSATAKSISGGRFLYCCGSAGTSSATGWIAIPSVAPAPTTGAPVVSPPTTSPTPAPTTPTPTTSTPAPVRSPSPTHPPVLLPVPPSSPTPPPSNSPPPSPSPFPGAPPLLLTGAGLHPSTVSATLAGRAQVTYRLSRTAKITTVLQRCTASGCTVVARHLFASPGGPSHLSLHAITGHWTLAAAHYRLTISWPGGRPLILRLVVAAAG